MDVYPCKVWSADRLVKKTFMSSASITSVISEGKLLGLHGSKLVLESDGSEICSDSVLEYYLKSNTTLMLLDNDEWTDRFNTTSSNALYTGQAETVRSHIESATNDTLSNTENSEYSTSDPIVIAIDNPNSENIDESNGQLIFMTIPSDSTDVDSDATTMTMSSGALTTTSDTTDAAKQLFENFQIPWQKVPSDILNLLINHKQLGKRLNVFANLLIDELRISSYYIPMSILRSVTQQAIIKYPDSFLEKDNEGNVISTTTVPLLTIMRNRNNFLNRTSNCNTSEFDPKIPLKQRRRSNLLQKTCTNWQPKNIHPPETMSSSEYKKNYLKSLYGKTVNSEEKQVISTYMNDCFALQRTHINCMDPIPTIENIKSQWPYIFEREYLYQHFKELMSFDSRLFVNNFKCSQQQILRFFHKNKKSDWLDTEQSEEISIISAITKYFGDDLCYLQKNFEIGTSMDEIVKQIPTNTPFIAFVKRDIGQKTDLTYIFIEKVLVAHFVEENYNYLNTLTDVINYYYVFNIMYPRQLSQSMEFLVRFFYKHYPNSTRGPKKNINNLQKVNNLISQISKS